MSHITYRRKKLHCSCPRICLLICLSFYPATLVFSQLRAWTCRPISRHDEIAQREVEWRYQNGVTGLWYHWQLGSEHGTPHVPWTVKWLNVAPTSSLGVIVYLTRVAEIEALQRSMTQLSRLLINQPRPIVIFHTGDFDDTAVQQSLAQILGPRTPLGFERVEFTENSAQPQSVLRNIRLGYYHMCRFFTLMLPTHPLLTLFQYYWRLDSHSYIFAPAPIRDPFEVMAAERIQYAFSMVNEEGDGYVFGLWSFFRKFLADRCLAESHAVRKTQTGWLGGYSFAIIFTNFAVANASLFRDHRLIRAWLHAVNDAGGIYRYRWGDAPIHTLALTQFVPRHDIVRLRYFGYWHNREYVCAHGTDEESCRQQVKAFATDPKAEYLVYDDGCYPSTWISLCHYYREIR